MLSDSVASALVHEERGIVLYDFFSHTGLKNFSTRILSRDQLSSLPTFLFTCSTACGKFISSTRVISWKIFPDLQFGPEKNAHLRQEKQKRKDKNPHEGAPPCTYAVSSLLDPTVLPVDAQNSVDRFQPIKIISPMFVKESTSASPFFSTSFREVPKTLCSMAPDAVPKSFKEYGIRGTPRVPQPARTFHFPSWGNSRLLQPRIFMEKPISVSWFSSECPDNGRIGVRSIRGGP